MLMVYGLRPDEVDNISSVMLKTWDRLAHHERMKDIESKKLETNHG